MGAPINEPDEKGFSPIHMAACTGHSKSLRELCRCKCDIDAPVVPPPRTDRHKNILENMTAVHLAAFYGHTQTLFELQELSCNIDPPAWWGSPLLSAVIASQSEAVRVLVTLRCD